MDFCCQSGVDHALYFTPPSTPDDIHGDSNTPPGELLHQATSQQKTGEDEICDLPLVQEDVNELCKTRPLTINLLYTTLNLNLNLNQDSSSTMKAIKLQQYWRCKLIKWFEVNQYSATEQLLLETGPYSSYYRGLETFAEYAVACDGNHKAFQIRNELQHIAPASQLSQYILTFRLANGPNLKRKRATASFPGE